MGAMSPWHWAIVLIVLVLLFGSTRLPGAARGLGRSLRIFKSEMKEMGDSSDDSAGAESSSSGSAQQTPQALPQQESGRQHGDRAAGAGGASPQAGASAPEAPRPQQTSQDGGV